jgi:hypothetical protein
VRLARRAPVGRAGRAERRRRTVGRPSVVEESRSAIEELATEKDSEGSPVQSKEVVCRLQAKGYDGDKTVYTLIKTLREDDDDEFITRFEGMPGEFCQHDFGQVDVRFADGALKRVHFFASRLTAEARVVDVCGEGAGGRQERRLRRPRRPQLLSVAAEIRSELTVQV